MIPTEPTLYLKEHLGCKFSIAEDGKHKRKWSKGRVLQESDINNPEINCCQQLPNEIILEADYDKETNAHLLEYAENILIKSKAGYFFSHHHGKSDYLWFKFKTKQQITPELRKAIIRYFTKPGFNFDENFFSLNFVRPVPNRYHWKHSMYNEKPYLIHEGEDLDIDKLGIKAPEIDIKPVKSGSVQYISLDNQKVRGWANAVSIVRLAKRKGWENCPICNNVFEFNDKLGYWKCPSCKIMGGMVKFVKFMLLQREERI